MDTAVYGPEYLREHIISLAFLSTFECFQPSTVQASARVALTCMGALTSNPLLSTTAASSHHKFVMKIAGFSQRVGHKLVVKSTKATIDVGLPRCPLWLQFKAVPSPSGVSSSSSSTESGYGAIARAAARASERA